MHRRLPILFLLALSACAGTQQDSICPGLEQCRFADPCTDTGQIAAHQGSFRRAPLLGAALLEACRGDKAAALILGESLERGVGLPEDPGLASRWYRLAAVATPGQGSTRGELPGKPGYPEAAFRLGVMHLEGRGVPQDFAAARYWLGKAAAEGHRRAILALDAVPRGR